ncbi:ABC transporter permease [candidate division WOR-3 bacterium]|nr:ABC transporter permease [candidate division WOR-3 bacterium]
MKIFSLWLKLAGRNILRNKKRSFLTSLSVGMGLAVLIFTDAFILGFQDYMRISATSIFSGEAQIHAENYLETMQAQDTLFGYRQVVERIKERPEVLYFAPRILSTATVTSASDIKYIYLAGVDPEKERNISVFDDCLVEGVYLSSDNQQDILLGKDLARSLGVDSGDKVVVTVAQPFTGQIYQELFRVSGIFETDMEEINKTVVLVNIERASQILALEGSVHEIAVKFKNSYYAENLENDFFSEFSLDGNKTAGWTELYPDVSAFFDLAKISVGVVALIIFFIVSLGIVNTMFMAIYDRIFEFGVIRAIGAKKSFVFGLIIIETFILCLWSVLLGCVAGFLVTYFFSVTGIDYQGIEYENVLLRTIYPSLNLSQFYKYPLLLLALSLAIAIYPASYASRISLTKAVKKTL